MSARPQEPLAVVEVDDKDFPVYCPNPRMPIWSSHPRVFLDPTITGEAKCSYCGTVYRLKPGAVIKHGH